MAADGSLGRWREMGRRGARSSSEHRQLQERAAHSFLSPSFDDRLSGSMDCSFLISDKAPPHAQPSLHLRTPGTPAHSRGPALLTPLRHAASPHTPTAVAWDSAICSFGGMAAIGRRTSPCCGLVSGPRQKAGASVGRGVFPFSRARRACGVQRPVCSVCLTAAHSGASSPVPAALSWLEAEVWVAGKSPQLVLIGSHLLLWGSLAKN